MNTSLRIGTRGSKLALWQAYDLKAQLKEQGIDSQLVIIKTKGDKIQDLGFDKIEGKGFFTKEIEDALLSQEVDVAVHSMKDLPTQSVEGLSIAAVSRRANPRDILICSKDLADTSRPLRIKEGARIGTSSIRRKVQLASLDASLTLVDIRGNVPTRISKIGDGDVDGLVLASAGVDRLDLDLSQYTALRLHPSEFVPAPAQGVIAYQCRQDDPKTKSLLKLIHHSEVSACTNVERGLLRLLDGGCQLPLGVYCDRDESGNFHCHAALGTTPLAPIKRVAYSQSTTSGMAERILDMLTA